MKLAVFALLLVVLPFQASSYVCDTLIVEVQLAHGLSGDDLLNRPDGYVKAIVDGKIKQTHVIDNNVNPVWNKDLKFTNVRSDKVRVEVWEEDGFFHGGDDHLKTCDEKLKLGSHVYGCGKAHDTGRVWYVVHCLKGNMKRQRLTYTSNFFGF